MRETYAEHQSLASPKTRRSTERGHTVSITLTKMASAVLAPLTVAAITVATEAYASAGPTAGFVAQQRLDDDGTGVGPNTGPDPNLWNGGDPAGGTGLSAGPDTGSGPGYYNGGNPAGGTGPADTGPDIGSGPGIWNGGQSAGAS
jgi:hypothetical protein